MAIEVRALFVMQIQAVLARRSEKNSRTSGQTPKIAS
jgi:hypothetical protein